MCTWRSAPQRSQNYSAVFIDAGGSSYRRMMMMMMLNLRYIHQKLLHVLALSLGGSEGFSCDSYQQKVSSAYSDHVPPTYRSLFPSQSSAHHLTLAHTLMAQTNNTKDSSILR
jgi:hypothetical protein